MVWPTAIRIPDQAQFTTEQFNRELVLDLSRYLQINRNHPCFSAALAKRRNSISSTTSNCQQILAKQSGLVRLATYQVARGCTDDRPGKIRMGMQWPSLQSPNNADTHTNAVAGQRAILKCRNEVDDVLRPEPAIMLTSDPLAILLKHDRWATGNILKASADLEQADFHRTFEMGPGSLHNTLTHILSALQGWGDLLAGRDQRDRLEGPRRSVAELTELHKQLMDDFESSVATHKSDESVSGERGGRNYTFTRSGVVTHVMTHGMHHRAQCLNMLRHIGVDPLPHSSVVEWMLMVDSQGY